MLFKESQSSSLWIRSESESNIADESKLIQRRNPLPSGYGLKATANKRRLPFHSVAILFPLDTV